MRQIDRIYIDGQFVQPHGRELYDLHDPAKGVVNGQVRLADAEDARAAIAAADRAQPAFARTTKAERLDMLRTLHASVSAAVPRMVEAMVEEYGAPVTQANWMCSYAAAGFEMAARTLESFEFQRKIGTADVVLEPVGVVGLITPWNSNASFICNKLATAIAAGCAAVIKPSEMSAWQTDVLTEHLHAAGLPQGVFNIVTGRGEVVGDAITSSPDVAKISFTGSTAVGKAIVRASADTLKRVTLELGGKSPSVILDDADLATIVPALLQAGFGNSGQACIAGTRVLIHQDRLAELEAILQAAVPQVRVGDPHDPETQIGPMVSQKQWERVQRYIGLGVEGGARLLVGGEGRPEGLEGWFVRPTVFSGVTNAMTIAREEIFGPVLSVIAFKSEDEAIAIANDTTYGLSAYVFSSDTAHAERVAAQLQAGRVVINGAGHEPLAPFGGMKQSGLGRENGVYGLEAYLEPKTVLGARAA